MWCLLSFIAGVVSVLPLLMRKKEPPSLDTRSDDEWALDRAEAILRSLGNCDAVLFERGGSPDVSILTHGLYGYTGPYGSGATLREAYVNKVKNHENYVQERRTQALLETYEKNNQKGTEVR